MKSNVTLELDADLRREVRILAAEENTSISALLAARLEQIVRERKTYQRARKRALEGLRDGMDLRWTPPRSRERDSRAVDAMNLGSTHFPSSCGATKHLPRKRRFAAVPDGGECD